MSLAKLAEALPSMSQHRGGGGPPGRHVSRGGEGGHGQRDFFDGKRGGGEGAPGQEHPLQNEWAFWYMRRNGSRSQQESYEQAIRPLGSPFHSVEGFWAHYSHIKRPSSGPAGMANFTDVHMFRAGVKPMWEDPGNRYGGKFVLRVRKGLAARYWEEILLGIIGGQFPVDEVCGAVLSLRFQEDIISIWTKNAQNHDANGRISDTLVRLLQLPPGGLGEQPYKPHQLSLSPGMHASGGGGGGSTSRSPGRSPGGGMMSQSQQQQQHSQRMGGEPKAFTLS